MSKKPPKVSTNDESRIFPLLIAGLFCFLLATVLGIGSWNIFGSQARQSGVTDRFLVKVGIKTSSTPILEVATNTPQVEIKKEVIEEKIEKEENQDIDSPEVEKDKVNDSENTDAKLPKFEGVVAVEGGEFSTGGGSTLRPIKRVIVKKFLIAETEVTNSQYAEFIKENRHRSPKGWRKRKYRKNTENLPVVNVSWDDANKFCKWLSKKYKEQVRLPSQAEWELAARGPKRFKYPWGKEWNEEAVLKKKTKKPSRVKSFPDNVSPYGAYDMLGNVWEWTSEKIPYVEMKSEVMKKVSSKKSRIYLALGGSFQEDRKKLKNTFWVELKAKTRNESVGFRYVIIPKDTATIKDDGNTDDTK